VIPERYAGLLTVSGLIGGSRGLVDFIAHVRVLFDVFYPGVLQGDLLHSPGTESEPARGESGGAGDERQSPGAAIISQLVQSPVPFASGPELVGSIVTALGLHFVELQDLLQRRGGESFFDNSNITYSAPRAGAR
jgi:hypothetical protein